MGNIDSRSFFDRQSAEPFSIGYNTNITQTTGDNMNDFKVVADTAEYIEVLWFNAFTFQVEQHRIIKDASSLFKVSDATIVKAIEWGLSQRIG